MKKIKINAQVLVAVISLSLAGIIGLQAYLFRSAILVRDARFKSEAAQALEMVARRLEAVEAQRFLTERVKNPIDILHENKAEIEDSLLALINKNQAHADTIFFNHGVYTYQQYEVELDTGGMGNSFDRQIGKCLRPIWPDLWRLAFRGLCAVRV